MTEKDTKQKILEAASILFAQNGFSGASIRDIAAKADVNLAAINYHFGGKDNLYWKVFEYNDELLEAGIKKIGEETGSTVELAVETFKFFISGRTALYNTFKIFLSDNLSLPEGENIFEKCEQLGPPGGAVFSEKIRADLGDSISEEGQRWATEMIFSVLVHFGVIMNTNLMKEKIKSSGVDMSKDMEGALALSVEAHLNYLKEFPEKFKPNS